MQQANVLTGWKLEKAEAPSAAVMWLVPILSILLGLLFSSVFILLTGHNPVTVYRIMFEGAFGSSYGLSETVVKAIPLMLAALGVSLAFRMQLWNIGAEGQFYMGAFGATWVALSFPDWPSYLLLPAMFLAGFAAGGVWGFIPAVPKALFKVNETISTLLFNYIAILWVDYLVYGPWKDPKGMNFPLTAVFSDNAILPAFGRSRVHFGLVIAIVIAAILYIVLKYTKWGYEIRVSGQSQRAAGYSGMNYVRNVLVVMFISGGIAGIAGMAEVSGIIQRLQHGISPGYGYTAIIIAWLARLNPWSTLLVSFLLGGLLVGGYSLQTSGMSASIVSMLQGSILFFVLGGELFTQYRMKRKGSRSDA